jgi:hypothetical protein
MHSLLAEWLPVSIAPSDGDNLEVYVLDYDGIVHALVSPVAKMEPHGRSCWTSSSAYSTASLAKASLSTIRFQKHLWD